MRSPIADRNTVPILSRNISPAVFETFFDTAESVLMASVASLRLEFFSSDLFTERRIRLELKGVGNLMQFFVVTLEKNLQDVE